ncbi:MAG: M28 family peptidase [Flavobacteriales bacterium]
MKSIFLLSLLAVTTISYSQKVDKALEKRLAAHVKVLAADDMQGRATGSDGERKAANYIVEHFRKSKLKPLGDSLWYQVFTFIPHAAGQVHHKGDTASLGMALVQEIQGTNIVGIVDNDAATTVVIGAHYDHLGMGDENSLWTGPSEVHNGADDNASGVSVMLELASWLAEKPEGTKSHNYLFIAFSGEEKGLLGSNHFTKNPTIPISEMDYMINMDMVGRLNKERSLAINGVGTSPSWMPVINGIDVDSLVVVTSESGMGASDHTSFYLSDVPALHFFTGQHEDYHKPTDDFDGKINVSGMSSVTRYIREVILSLDNEEKLVFTKTKDATPSSSDFKVTLGVMPDYLYSGKGLRIDGCKDGKPGFKAGLQKGDTIMKLGDFAIEDIYGYMEALGKFEKGQSTTMEVEREGKVLELKVTWE